MNDADEMELAYAQPPYHAEFMAQMPVLCDAI